MRTWIVAFTLVVLGLFFSISPSLAQLVIYNGRIVTGSSGEGSAVYAIPQQPMTSSSSLQGGGLLSETATSLPVIMGMSVQNQDGSVCDGTLPFCDPPAQADWTSCNAQCCSSEGAVWWSSVQQTDGLKCINRGGLQFPFGGSTDLHWLRVKWCDAQGKCEPDKGQGANCEGRCCSAKGQIWPTGATGQAIILQCSENAKGLLWEKYNGDTPDVEQCNPAKEGETCLNKDCWPPSKTAYNQAEARGYICKFNGTKHVWHYAEDACDPPPSDCLNEDYRNANPQICDYTQCDTCDKKLCKKQSCLGYEGETAIDWDYQTYMACTNNSEQDPVWVKVSDNRKCSAAISTRPNGTTKFIHGRMSCKSKEIKSVEDITKKKPGCCGYQTYIESGQGNGESQDVFSKKDLSSCGVDRSQLGLVKCVVTPDESDPPPFQTDADGNVVYDAQGKPVLLYEPKVALEDGVVTFSCFGGGTVDLYYEAEWEEVVVQ